MVILDASNLVDSGYEILPNGSLLAKNVKLARSGIADYFGFELGAENPGLKFKKIKANRPSALFDNPQFLRSIEESIVTFTHPPTEDKTVAPNERKYYQVGHPIAPASKITEGDVSYAVCDLLITDLDTVEEIKNGVSEISIGYYGAQFSFNKGISDEGDEYDIDFGDNLRANHIAILKKGRCGAQCKIHPPKQGKLNMSQKIKIGVTDHDVSDEVKNYITSLITSNDALNGEITGLRAATVTDEAIRVRVKEGVKSKLAEIKEILAIDPTFDYENGTLIDAKKAMIKATQPSISLENKSDEFINGIFAGLKITNSDPLSSTIFAPKAGVIDSGEVDHYAAYVKKLENRYKGDK